jgi:hypothetical protein
LIFLKRDPMSHLRSCWWTFGRRLDGRFKSRINLFEFPKILLFAKLGKEACDGLI